MRTEMAGANVPHASGAEMSLPDAAEAATHLAASAQAIGGDDPLLAAFFTAFARHAAPEDLVHYSGAELAQLIRRVYELTACRPCGQSLVALFNPWTGDSARRNETILLAVNDDVPFLYDSATAEVRAQGASIAVAFHPVIATGRDARGNRVAGGQATPESVIVLGLEGVLDESEKARLTDGLLAVFSDVRA